MCAHENIRGRVAVSGRQGFADGGDQIVSLDASVKKRILISEILNYHAPSNGTEIIPNVLSSLKQCR